MWATPVVIAGVLTEDGQELVFRDDEHVIEAVPAHTAEQAFAVGVGQSRRMHPMKTVRLNVFVSRISFTRCSDASSSS
jgi:hypothetical protein